MVDLTRRGFLGCVGAGAVGLLTRPAATVDAWAAPAGMPGVMGADGLAPPTAPLARFWAVASAGQAGCSSCHADAGFDSTRSHAHAPGVVQCQLCAHQCVLGPGERGRCRARQNVDGKLHSLVYGRPVTEHLDPIEKKPFFHFLPGAAAYSLATVGCPLRCRFCQNWQISQARPEDYPVPFVSAADMAGRARDATAPVIAFTYNEPTVFCEYLIDVATAARQQGIRPVLVSCGYMNEAPLTEMLAVLDAVKIDLKGFRPAFYRDVSAARLEPVLRSIGQVARSGRHLELVNLVVPSLNDDAVDLAELCRWVAGELGPDVPLHFTRFHPDYQLAQLPPTPVATLERAWDTARAAGLHYAYVGNVPGHPGSHTYCPKCAGLCLERRGVLLARNLLLNGCCPRCGTRLAGVWA